MAGPGGGPPRKSHTKSRNGCKTCKRRHIRCDETFPQCRNCTKHNCRCDYMDVQATTRDETSRSPASPNLLTTPEIELELESWRTTGISPFPELSQSPRNDWYRFPRTDLRLIHHIAGLSIDFHRRGLGNSTVWAPKMPCFLAIAMSSGFVLSSILAFSASHLAYITGSQETENLSFHHRGIAFKGLQNAISTFSKDNCDAILAASILLSWQATEWSSLASLQRGMQSVLDAMHPYWKGSSEVAQFLEGQKAFRSVESSTDTEFLNSTTRFQKENLERIDGAIMNLRNIQDRVQYNREYFDRITDLLSFVRQLRTDLPIQSPETAFERLQPLRTWLFWLPTKMIRGGEGEMCALALLAQFFATALVLEPLFPEIGGFYFGGMAVTPVEAIDSIILSRKSTHPYVPEVHMAASMMEFPHHTIIEYKSRIQWAQQLRPRGSVTTANPPSPYDSFHGLGYATIAPYTTALHTPPTLALPSPSFNLSNPYDHRGSSTTIYTGSPLLSDRGEENLSDYSRSGTLEHSPAFSPYLDELHSGISVADTTGALNMGLLHESPMMTLGSVAPELWT